MKFVPGTDLSKPVFNEPKSLNRSNLYVGVPRHHCLVGWIHYREGSIEKEVTDDGV